ncbi:tRNA adenylylTrase [Nucleospora cyclopteri]
MIIFNDKEKKIINNIKKYAESINVTPRIAGGWVRDKILGFNSDDLDIALDKMSGYSFAQGLIEYLGITAGVYLISANPEKSKHLETAVVHIYDMDIDFVHLRTEKYTNSRIPQIELGTAEEDALRRDITINALFYNIITDKIEDFTGKGIADLNNEIIDTPLDPIVTLKDDPLRILRIFRFKIKLNFIINERFYEAIKIAEIREAFKNKVSAERVGKEIKKMINYKNGYIGLLEIAKCNFLEIILKPKIDKSINIESMKLFINRLRETFSDEVEKSEIRLLIYLYICLHQFSMIKTEKFFINQLIIKDSLKYSTILIKSCKTIEENLIILHKTNLKNISTEKITSLVLDLGFLWKESLIIFYCMSNCQYVVETILNIEENNLNTRCFSTQFKINGTFLLSKINIKNKKEIPTYLKKTKIIEILNPSLEPEEILDKLFNCKI